MKKLKQLLSPQNWLNKLKELYRTKKELVMYIVFGAATTAVSYLSYFAFRIIFPDGKGLGAFSEVLGFFKIESDTALPVILSWIISVMFAYVTNRIFVFKSHVKNAAGVLKEAFYFFLARVLTLLTDLLIMYLLVDFTGINNFLYEFAVKLFSSVITVILNYVFSKVFVFRNKKPE